MLVRRRLALGLGGVIEPMSARAPSAAPPSSAAAPATTPPRGVARAAADSYVLTVSSATYTGALSLSPRASSVSFAYTAATGRKPSRSMRNSA